MLVAVTADDETGEPASGESARRGLHFGRIEQLADVFVFAPLGFVLEARSLWPDLADRGREGLRQLHGHASAAVDGLGLAGTNGASPRHDEAVEPRPGAAARRRPPRLRAERDHSVPVVDVATLAIPDYDSLSASQVVPRLAGLDADELEQVRLYESGTRARNTILNRIAQLQAE
jgi:hypothetical protein